MCLVVWCIIAWWWVGTEWNCLLDERGKKPFHQLSVESYFLSLSSFKIVRVAGSTIRGKTVAWDETHPRNLCCFACVSLGCYLRNNPPSRPHCHIQERLLTRPFLSWLWTPDGVSQSWFILHWRRWIRDSHIIPLWLGSVKWVLLISNTVCGFVSARTFFPLLPRHPSTNQFSDLQYCAWNH